MKKELKHIPNDLPKELHTQGEQNLGLGINEVMFQEKELCFLLLNKYKSKPYLRIIDGHSF